MPRRVNPLTPYSRSGRLVTWPPPGISRPMQELPKAGWIGIVPDMPATNPDNGSWRVKLWICLALAAANLVVFWPVRQYEFVNFDDHTYVSQNPHVQSGLSWPGLVWAFQAGYAANWHPLTWLSHMLDVQIFGLRPGPHHLVNLLFHLANTLLLFLLFHKLTGALWRSAFVAALFALHPLHVESVAWIAERKDLLSTFFGLLAIWAYVSYVEKSNLRSLTFKVQGSRFNVQRSEFEVPAPHWPSSILYLLSLLLFALSLMCKPMLVTLPFLLLLLDYWPLGRLSLKTQNSKLKTLFSLLREKVPFLALSIASSVITVHAQKAGQALLSVDALPLWPRVANALVSYVRYIGKALWPSHLALPYPYLEAWPLATVLLAVVTVAGGSFIALRCVRRRPYFTVGWFWYLGTLVPVIGLVQVGPQAMADRYTYLPMVGLFLGIVWTITELSSRWPHRSRILACAVVVLLLLCAVGSHRQLAHWQNSVTLFERAVAVTTRNYLAHHDLGEALEKQGRLDDAKSHLVAALEIRPDLPQAHYELGLVLFRQGHTGEAIAHYREALRLRPGWEGPLNNLAWLLATHRSAEFRNGPEAVALAERVCQLTGGTNVAMLDTLAAAYAEAGRFPEAVSTGQKACDLAAAAGRKTQADSFQRRLELYRSGHAYHSP
jgi:protein O-mannosyl-transferase